MLLNPPPTPLMLREVSGGAGPWRVLLGNLLDPDWIFLILTHVIWTVRFSDSVFLSPPPRLSSHLIHLSVMAREENKLRLIDASKHFSLLDVLPALSPPPRPSISTNTLK